jgi:putative ABC transport system substrate-binding protein
MMDRRAFAGGLAATTATHTVRSQAQPARLPLIGFLNSGSPEPFRHLNVGFLKGLAEAGFVDGRNCKIEYRWAQGDYATLPAFAEELVKLPVDILVSGGGTPAAQAARAATGTIPIVFVASDPVAIGLVRSIARPGGNATGISLLNPELATKRVQLLAELVPKARSLALLTNQVNPEAITNVAPMQAFATAFGRTLVVTEANSPAAIDAAFVRMASAGVEALVVNNDPFLFVQRERIVELAARNRLPAIYDLREFAVAGGLMSYGTNLVDSYRRLGLYAARVLAGAAPADLPVWQPTHFELVLNTRTATALKLDIPATILVRADEVIE